MLLHRTFSSYPLPLSARLSIAGRIGAFLLLLATSAQAQTPTLTGFSPTRNARTAARTTNVAAMFGQTLGNTASTQQALKVFSQQAGGQKSGATTVSGNTLSFNPTADFKAGETVLATVTTGVQSGGGQNLATAQVLQFTTAVTPSAGTFGGGSAVPVGPDTRGLAVGDIDGDGDLDLATPSFGVASGSVSVRRNSGSGTFTGNEEVAVGPYARSVAFGDVDGDGDLDLVTANGTSDAAVSIRLNNGSGTFSGSQNIALNREMNDVALGDVDGDGDLDIVVAGPVGIVIMIRNLGGGTFTGISSFLFTTSDIYSLVLGDVDSDGDLDFIANGYTTGRTVTPGQVRIGFNDGTGTFVPAAPILVGLFSQDVSAGDLDGDGDLDLAVANRGSNTVSFLLNNGTGAFTSGGEIGLVDANSVSLNDVDGDGDLDLLAGSLSTPYQVSVRLNNGAGSFSGSQQISVGNSSARLELGDLDGDGDLDLLAAGGNTVSVRLNRSQPVLASLSVNAGAVGSSVVLTGSGFTGATSVTFNGVAATSFVVNSATQITVTVPAGATTGPVVVTTPEGTSNGLPFTVSAAPIVTAVSPARNAPSAPGTSAVSVTYNQALSDNATTRQALKVFSQQASGKKSGTTTVSGNSIAFAPSTAFRPGETVFATATAAAQSSTGVAATPHVFQFTTATAPATGVFSGSEVSVGTGPANVAVGDVDSDGDLDLVTRGSGNTATLQLNTGAGTFTTSSVVNLGGAPADLAFGDVDADGDLDLLTLNANRTISVRLNNGSGTFSGTQEIVLIGNPSPEALSLAIGDIDGDGDLDLLASCSSPSSIADTRGTIYVRFNNGAGTFTGDVVLDVNVPVSIALGDIDGDGDLDLLAPFFGTGRVFGNFVAPRLNDGAGNFSEVGTLTTLDYFPAGVALGDLDRDGDLDLVTANRSSTVSVRLNNGGGTFTGSENLPSNEAARVTLGDVDGDGDLDLLVTSLANTVNVHLNNGTGGFGAAQLVAVGTNPLGIATGDLDGNGTLDFLTANSMSNTVSVRLNQAAATSALAVTELSPARNARSAPRVADVAVTFNQALSTGAATQQALKIFSQQAGGRKAGTATVSGNTLALNPTADFKAGETVFATLTTAAQSSSGASLAKPQVFQFTTATAPSNGTFDGGPNVPVLLPQATKGIVGDVDGDGDLDLVALSKINTGASFVSVRLNNGSASFSNAQDIAGNGANLSNIAFGDVDGDGDLDLLITVAPFPGPGTVGVWLNNGSGTFTASAQVTIAGRPFEVAVGDGDGDGDLDLFVANDENVVSICFNNGAGTFSGIKQVSASSFRGLALGDVDGDGDLDFLTAGNQVNGSVSVRLNDGAGNFSVGQEVAVGTFPLDVALGDFDGDGDLDMAAANSGNSTVSVRFNNGLGSFSGTTEVAIGDNSHGLDIGDVDGDGDLDFVAANLFSNTVSVRLNNGQGAFVLGQEVSVTGPYDVTLGDVNGDNRVDLIAPSYNATSVTVRLNQASTTPALAVMSLSPARNARSAPRATDVAVTFNQALSTGAATQQALKVFSAQAGGQKAGTATVSGNTLTLNPATDFKAGETVFATLTTAAQSSSGASLAVPQVFQFTTATSSSNGSFGGGSDPAVGTTPLSVTTGDVDGDGDLDLLTANVNTNTVSIRLNNGAAGFAGSQEVSVGRGPSQVVLSDVDGDGDLDLATANSRTIFPGTVSVRLNNGQGSFSGTTEVAVGDTPHAVALADVDGDGDLDLLAANYTAGSGNTSTVSVRLNNGLGTFSGTQDVSIGTRPLSIAVGDVDADGDLDFVTANSNQVTASVRLNDGKGTFSGSIDVTVGPNPNGVALGDLDGDGDLDLVVANGDAGRLRVLPNTGNGTFAAGQEVVVGSLPQGVVLGDVDGDGDLDLATANNGYDAGRTVSVRLNNGSGSFGGAQEVNLGAAPSGLALADLDGDGDLDLLTANSSSNTVSVRLNQNAARGVLAASAALIEQVSVYPNPAHTTTQLLLPASLTAQPMQVRVLNSMGQVVWEQQLTARQTTATSQLVLGKLPTGVYSLRLGTAAGVITKRLLVE
ncbi:FG-GAP-like repeat-containing protein [Hymenobacter sp. GOD-10R]|uniref:FG-GAP-like repeat-containing protein n=1 Tax=Hymenobacter sp. GOD-10R TaxID=3093922 RepID=UPI002D779FEF|nr:FG-GAP-like repeat-containing protein [Hymenobacter sp. GOD-10R]WRQ31051.1 FG-GAP-like repeat-containing protein [Hymenobacter sp. GOD-10R]